MFQNIEIGHQLTLISTLRQQRDRLHNIKATNISLQTNYNNAIKNYNKRKTKNDQQHKIVSQKLQKQLQYYKQQLEMMKRKNRNLGNQLMECMQCFQISMRAIKAYKQKIQSQKQVNNRLQQEIDKKQNKIDHIYRMQIMKLQEQSDKLNYLLQEMECQKHTKQQISTTIVQTSEIMQQTRAFKNKYIMLTAKNEDNVQMLQTYNNKIYEINENSSQICKKMQQSKLHTQNLKTKINELNQEILAKQANNLISLNENKENHEVVQKYTNQCKKIEGKIIINRSLINKYQLNSLQKRHTIQILQQYKDKLIKLHKQIINYQKIFTHISVQDDYISF